jgi:iron complex outermembrane receptor protein
LFRDSLSGGVQYTHPLGTSASLILRTDYRYRSEYFTALDNDPISLQEANTLIDLSATFEMNGGRYAVQIWGKNVTDEGVRNIVFDTPLQNGSYNAFLEAPQTFGITGRLRF